MTILGTFEDDDHRPESGTLVVRDDGAYEKRGPFGRHGSKVQPCGTIVRAGNGWLEGAAGSGPDVVRMEAHDAAPENDTADWEDAVDIPYRSLSGAVRLGYTTGGSSGDVLALSGAGAHRVRVTRRRTGEGARGDRWLLRFWPTEPAPPRWWKRRENAVRPAEPGWANLFSYEFGVLLRAVAETQEEPGGATIGSLRQWFARHGRGDWLDHSVRDRVPVLMHPSDFARQLGIPEPDTLADTLDVFVAAGVLAEDGGSYRKPAVTPNPEDVIEVPDRQRDRLVQQRDHDRFCEYAADLVSVALWHGSSQTLAGLADRTLVPETDVRATLEWAERQDLLHVTGSLDATFTMTL
jgi:hypothetical protein